MLSPTFFHDLVAQTPVRVIALAGTVTVLVQAVKAVWPNAIGGKWAIALNLLMSLAAIFVGMSPTHFWSETTLAQVLMVAAAAAGVHGTAKSLSAKYAAVGEPAAPDPPQERLGRVGSSGTGGTTAGSTMGGWTMPTPGTAAKLNTTAADPQLNQSGAKPVPPM